MDITLAQLNKLAPSQTYILILFLIYLSGFKHLPILEQSVIIYWCLTRRRVVGSGHCKSKLLLTAY